MKKIGVYIHIPFCKQKCIYCDFVSFAGKENMQIEYIEALKKEIRNFINRNNDVKIETIYIGGGTPSYIKSSYIKEVIDLFKSNIQKKCQITIEVNPGTIDKSKLIDYKNAGINRISIGLQSTQDNLLKQINRIHNYKEFLEAYKLIRKTGFDNVNVDLMIGIPKQTINDVKQSLEKVTKLDPEHISVYSLIIEEGTPIEKLLEEGILELPDEELERNMYWYVKNYLELKGYKHYEISNFSKEGFESKHNLDCWNQKEYIGFGLNASSYYRDKRFRNISDIGRYIKNINENRYKDNIIIEEVQTKQDKMKEYMLLGLRKINGISIQKFENKFNENPIMLYRNKLEMLVDDELILIDGDYIKLTNKGIDRC